MADTVILTRSQYESLAGPITPEERRKYNGWEATAAITDCLLNRRLSAPAKSAEERVAVKKSGPGDVWRLAFGSMTSRRILFISANATPKSIASA